MKPIYRAELICKGHIRVHAPMKKPRMRGFRLPETRTSVGCDLVTRFLAVIDDAEVKAQ